MAETSGEPAGHVRILVAAILALSAGQLACLADVVLVAVAHGGEGLAVAVLVVAGNVRHRGLTRAEAAGAGTAYTHTHTRPGYSLFEYKLSHG